METRVISIGEMSKLQARGLESVGNGFSRAAVITQGKISGFLRVYNRQLQKLRGSKYDKITASVCARFNLRCMYIIKNRNTPQIYLDAVRTRLLPDYHAANCEVARDCGKYPFTEAFKEILTLYTEMELEANTPDRIAKTLMSIFYEIAEFDGHVEDIRCMATVATIQILLSIDGYHNIKNNLLKKLAVKLGSPILSEIFASCDGKDVNECKRAIPMDHPDIQKIRKAVEVFNSWFSSFVDFEDHEDEEDDEFEGTPSYKEMSKTESLADIKEELLSVKDESSNQVATMDLTGNAPVVSLTWEVRTDMRKKCNQKAYGLVGSATPSPTRKNTQKSKNTEVLCIVDDDVTIVKSKKRKNISSSKTSSPIKSRNTDVRLQSTVAKERRSEITASDEEIMIVSIDSEPTKQSVQLSRCVDTTIEIVDDVVPKKEIENVRKSLVFDEMEVIVLDEEDEQVEIVEETASQLQTVKETASLSNQQHESIVNTSNENVQASIIDVVLPKPIQEIALEVPTTTEMEVPILEGNAISAIASSVCNEGELQTEEDAVETAVASGCVQEHSSISAPASSPGNESEMPTEEEAVETTLASEFPQERSSISALASSIYNESELPTEEGAVGTALASECLQEPSPLSTLAPSVYNKSEIPIEEDAVKAAVASKFLQEDSSVAVVEETENLTVKTENSELTHLYDVTEVSKASEIPAVEAKNTEETTEVQVQRDLQELVGLSREDNEVPKATETPAAEAEKTKEVTDTVILEENVQENSEQLIDLPDEVNEVLITTETPADKIEKTEEIKDVVVLQEVAKADRNEITSEEAVVKETEAADEFERTYHLPEETWVDSTSKTDHTLPEVEANKLSEHTTIIETETGSVVNEMPDQNNIETTDKLATHEENETANECSIEEEFIPQEQTAVVIPENENGEVLEIHSISIAETLEISSNLPDETTTEEISEPVLIETEDNSSQEVILECQTKQLPGEENILAFETEEGDSQASADTVSSSDQTLLDLKLSLQIQQSSKCEKTIEKGSRSGTHKEKGRHSSTENKKAKSSSRDRDLERSRDRKDSDKRDKCTPRKRRESTSSAKHKSKEPESRRGYVEESQPKRRKRKASQDYRHSHESTSHKKEKIEVTRERKDSKGYGDKRIRSDSRCSRESDSKKNKDKKREESKLPVKEATASPTVLDEFEDFLKSSPNKTREAKKSDSDAIFSDISDGSFDLDSDDEREKTRIAEKEKTNARSNKRSESKKTDTGYQNSSSRRAKSYDVSSRESSSSKSKRSSTVDRSIDVKSKPKTRREDERNISKSRRDSESKSHSQHSRLPPSKRKSIEKLSEITHKKETEEKLKKDAVEETKPYRARSREANRKSNKKSTSGTFLKSKPEKEVIPEHSELSVQHPKTVIPEIFVTTVDQTTNKQDMEKEVVAEPVKPQPRRSRRLSALYATSPKYEEYSSVHETTKVAVEKPSAKDDVSEVLEEKKVDKTLSTETTEDLHGDLQEGTPDSLQVTKEVDEHIINQDQIEKVQEQLEASKDVLKETPQKPDVVVETLQLVPTCSANIPQNSEIVQNIYYSTLEPQIPSGVFIDESITHVINAIDNNNDKGCKGKWTETVTMQPLETTASTSATDTVGDPLYKSDLDMLADMADVVKKEGVVQPSPLLNKDISQAFTRNHIHQEETFLSINKKTKHVDSNSSDDSDCGLTIIDASTPVRDDDNSRSPHSSVQVEDKAKPYKTTDHSIMSILTKDIKDRSPEQVQKKKQASLYLRQREQNRAVDLSQKLPTDPSTGCNQSSSIEPLKVRTKAERKEAQLLPVEVNLQPVSPRSNKRKSISPSKRTQLNTHYDETIISVSTLTDRLDENIAEIPKKRVRISAEGSTPKSVKSATRNGNKDRLFKRENVNKLVEAITACVKTNEDLSSRKSGRNEKKTTEESVTSIAALPLKGKNKLKKAKSADKKQEKVAVPAPPPLPPSPPPPPPPPPPQPVEIEIITSRMPPKKRETRKSFEGVSLIQEKPEIEIIPLPVATVHPAKNVKKSTKAPALKTRTKAEKKLALSCRRSSRQAHMSGFYEEVENNFEVMSEPEEAKAKAVSSGTGKRRRRKSKSKALTEAKTTSGSSPTKLAQERVDNKLQLEIFPIETRTMKRRKSECSTLTSQVEEVEGRLEISIVMQDGSSINDSAKRKEKEVYAEMNRNEGVDVPCSPPADIREKKPLPVSLDCSVDKEKVPILKEMATESKEIYGEKTSSVTIERVKKIVNKRRQADKNEDAKGLAVIIEKVFMDNEEKGAKEKKNKKRAAIKKNEKYTHKKPPVFVVRVEDHTDKEPAVIVERIEEYTDKEPAVTVEKAEEYAKQEPTVVVERVQDEEPFIAVQKVEEPAAVESVESYAQQEPAVVARVENYTDNEPVAIVESVDASAGKESSVIEKVQDEEPPVIVEEAERYTEQEPAVVPRVENYTDGESAAIVEKTDASADRELPVVERVKDNEPTYLPIIVQTSEMKVLEEEMSKGSVGSVEEAKMDVNEELAPNVERAEMNIDNMENSKEPAVIVEKVGLYLDKGEESEGLAVMVKPAKMNIDQEEERKEPAVEQTEAEKPPVAIGEEAEMSVDVEKPDEGPAVIVQRIEVEEVEMHENDHLMAASAEIMHTCLSNENVRVEPVEPEIEKVIHVDSHTIKQPTLDMIKESTTSAEVAPPSAEDTVHILEDSQKASDLVKISDEVRVPEFELGICSEKLERVNAANSIVLHSEPIIHSPSEKVTAKSDSLSFVETETQEHIKEDSSSDITAPTYSEITAPKSLPDNVSLTVDSIEESIAPSIAASSVSDLSDLIPDPSSNSIQDLLTSICNDLSTGASLKPTDTLATTSTMLFTEVDSLCRSDKVAVNLNATIPQPIPPPVLYEPLVTTVSTSSTIMSSSHAPSTSSEFVGHDPTGPLDFVNEIDYESLVLDDVEIPLGDNTKRSEDTQHNHSLGPFMGDSEQKSKNSSNDDLTALPEEKGKVFNKNPADATEKPQTDLEDNSPTAGTMLLTECGSVLDVDSLCQSEKAPVSLNASPPHSESVSFANERFSENSQVSCETNQVPVTFNTSLPPSESGTFVNELFSEDDQVPCGSNQLPGGEPTFPLINPDNAAQKFQLADKKELEDILRQPLVGSMDSGESNLNSDSSELDQQCINTPVSSLSMSQCDINPEVENVEFKKILLTKDYSGVSQSDANEDRGFDESVKQEVESDPADEHKSFGDGSAKQNVESDHGNEHEGFGESIKQVESDHANEDRDFSESIEQVESDNANEHTSFGESIEQVESDHANENKGISESAKQNVESDHANEHTGFDDESAKQNVECDHANEHTGFGESTEQFESDHANEDTGFCESLKQVESDHANEHSGFDDESAKQNVESDHANEHSGFGGESAIPNVDSDHANEHRDFTENIKQVQIDHANEHIGFDDESAKQNVESDHANEHIGFDDESAKQNVESDHANEHRGFTENIKQVQIDHANGHIGFDDESTKQKVESDLANEHIGFDDESAKQNVDSDHANEYRSLIENIKQVQIDHANEFAGFDETAKQNVGSNHANEPIGFGENIKQVQIDHANEFRGFDESAKQNVESNYANEHRDVSVKQEVESDHANEHTGFGESTKQVESDHANAHRGHSESVKRKVEGDDFGNARKRRKSSVGQACPGENNDYINDLINELMTVVKKEKRQRSIQTSTSDIYDVATSSCVEDFIATNDIPLPELPEPYQLEVYPKTPVFVSLASTQTDSHPPKLEKFTESFPIRQKDNTPAATQTVSPDTLDAPKLRKYYESPQRRLSSEDCSRLIAQESKPTPAVVQESKSTPGVAHKNKSTAVVKKPIPEKKSPRAETTPTIDENYYVRQAGFTKPPTSGKKIKQISSTYKVTITRIDSINEPVDVFESASLKFDALKRSEQKSVKKEKVETKMDSDLSFRKDSKPCRTYEAHKRPPLKLQSSKVIPSASVIETVSIKSDLLEKSVNLNRPVNVPTLSEKKPIEPHLVKNNVKYSSSTSAIETVSIKSDSLKKSVNMNRLVNVPTLTEKKPIEPHVTNNVKYSPSTSAIEPVSIKSDSLKKSVNVNKPVNVPTLSEKKPIEAHVVKDNRKYSPVRLEKPMFAPYPVPIDRRAHYGTPMTDRSSSQRVDNALHPRNTDKPCLRVQPSRPKSEYVRNEGKSPRIPADFLRHKLPFLKHELQAGCSSSSSSSSSSTPGDTSWIDQLGGFKNLLKLPGSVEFPTSTDSNSRNGKT